MVPWLASTPCFRLPWWFNQQRNRCARA